MQSFDSEIESLIFHGNKATDQNKFHDCKNTKTRTKLPQKCF